MRFLDERHYLPKGAPMLKRVLALPGQTVCRADRTITVDGITMDDASMATGAADRFRFGGSQRIPDGEFFLRHQQLRFSALGTLPCNRPAAAD